MDTSKAAAIAAIKLAISENREDENYLKEKFETNHHKLLFLYSSRIIPNLPAFVYYLL